MNRFIYYDVRPCITTEEETRSYDSLEEREQDVDMRQNWHHLHWSLYGRYMEGDVPISMCIGDYNTMDAAMEIYQRITGQDKTNVFILDTSLAANGLPA